MAELTISSDEIRGALERYVSSYTPEVSREEVGIVSDAGDGIAHVEGLPSTMANELLEFEDGTLGVALNLDVREIGVVILGDFTGIEEGQQVKRTGRVLSVPVGDAYLGRVVNSLGEPIDDRGEIASEGFRELELQAPNVMARQPVKEPLQTGIKAIDAMTPIGRGQRQLIIGDRKTGKTAVCIDTILNQKANWETGDPAKQVRCIYVAIGQKGTTIAAVRQSLEDSGALAYTTIVAAPASDSAGYKWLAPYTGSALGQHWMYQGKHVLIIFDDLSKQAEAYRALSLLLRRPPGREAYPGDVFYLHSRLLERCAKLSDELGGGSLTGLPIIETRANDISAYIPTNVISITDGQCFFESDLFNQGVRPAINVGVSVSRVGGAAQIKAMKSVGGTLRLELSQYRELEAFAAFGAENLDATSRRQLERGARLTELLKQGQHAPVPVEEQVVSIFLGTRGHLDDVAVDDVRRFESEFLADIRRHHSDILDTIRESKQFSDDTEQQVVDAVTAFKKEFSTSDGSSLGKEAEADAMDADEVERESVKVNRPGKKDNGSSKKDNASGKADSGSGKKDNGSSQKDDGRGKKDNAKSKKDDGSSQKDDGRGKKDNAKK
jgi:F-type H+/Na+-transporting ATPase subunit alpha